MSNEKSLPRVEWRDEFKTGVASVDHEHAELVELLNGILEALESSGDKDAVTDALGEVQDHRRPVGGALARRRGRASGGLARPREAGGSSRRPGGPPPAPARS